MSYAVGVLIVDEPPGLETSFRATLEHAPALRTISLLDLDNASPEPQPGHWMGTAVALVFAREAHLDAVCERIAELREGRPSLRVLVSFRALDAADLSRLIDAGADAFIARGAPARDVCKTILALAGGLAPLVDGAELAEAAQAEAPETLGLTPREAEVLRFLSAGFSNKEVARRLSLSVRTVETHRLNLRRKTQTGRLKDLVSLARQLGLDPVLDPGTPRGAARH